MKADSGDVAFRAQLVVPEQRQLYDYWLAKSAGRSMPCRADISPAEIPRLLPYLSLIEARDDAARCRIRLAGTRLRDIYDREITGLCVDDLDWGDKRDYWLAAYRRIIDEGKPTQGVVRGPRLHKEHVVQYWLKLPLADAAGRVTMILGYDHFQAAADQDVGVSLAVAR